MKKVTISALILASMVIGNVETVLANGFENDFKCNVEKNEEFIIKYEALDNLNIEKNNEKELNENLTVDEEKNIKEELQQEINEEKEIDKNLEITEKEEILEEEEIESNEEESEKFNFGWNLIEGKYFFVDDDNFFKKGWYNDGYDWYYLDENTGEMKTGWFNSGGYYYYFNESGTMKTGWLYDGYDYYYLNENGIMLTGWGKIDNHWYYLNQNGTMAKGWINLDNQWFYLKDNGVMVTGNKEINGTKYYFEDNGVMNNGMGLVVEARKHVGKAYVAGGNGPNAFDCSGLTKYVYNKMDISLERTTYGQVKQGRYISREELKPGDLVFSHGPASAPGHVGIYSGNGKYIHAANSREGVIESPIYKYSTARRIVED